MLGYYDVHVHVPVCVIEYAFCTCLYVSNSNMLNINDGQRVMGLY